MALLANMLQNRRSPRVWLAEHMLHFGWAIHSQECDCGFNRFNWLARRINEGRWTDDGEPADLRTKIQYEFGNAFVTAHGWLMRKVS